MKIATIILGTMLLTGCGIPSISFYDDNESLLAVEVRSSVDLLDCSTTQAPQVKTIQTSVNKFLFYSEAKGSSDVGEMIAPMKDTVDSFYDRVKDKDSVVFCNIKKKLMVQQSETIADAVMSRF